MNACSISIALCTYNGSRFLKQQLNSYLAQDLMPSELVACDDGSTDGTIAILRQFATSAPFPVRIEVNSQTLGITANFGRAISLCQGDVIALSDQDDVWSPAKLGRLQSVMDSNASIGMVFSDAYAIDETGQDLGYQLWNAVRFTQAERAIARRGHLFDVLLRHYVVTGATLAFRAAHRNLILPIPEVCLHDAWIALLLSAVAPAAIIDEPLIGYRQHATQASGGERVMSIFEQMERARSIGPSDHAITASRFEAARIRLESSLHASGLRDRTDRLTDKVLHARTRERLRQGFRKRLMLVAREVVNGRYRRYSHPWKAPLADLLL